MQPLLTPLTTNHAVYIGRYRFEFREPFGNSVSYSTILDRCCINRTEFDRIVKARIENAIREHLVYDVEQVDVGLEHNRVEILRNKNFRMPSQIQIPIPMGAELDGIKMTIHFHPWIPQEPQVVRNG